VDQTGKTEKLQVFVKTLCESLHAGFAGKAMPKKVRIAQSSPN
jgi:hypothetical protein